MNYNSLAEEVVSSTSVEITEDNVEDVIESAASSSLYVHQGVEDAVWKGDYNSLKAAVLSVAEENSYA